jgi:hypothetical protein
MSGSGDRPWLLIGADASRRRSARRTVRVIADAIEHMGLEKRANHERF